MYAMCNVFSFCFRAIEVPLVLYTTAFSPFLILINFEGIKNSFAYVFTFFIMPNNPYIDTDIPFTQRTSPDNPHQLTKNRAGENRNDKKILKQW